jgi:hypothetical protein
MRKHSSDQTLNKLYQNDSLPAAVRHGVRVQTATPPVSPVVLQEFARCFGRGTENWAPQNHNPFDPVISTSGMAALPQTFNRRCPQHPDTLPTRHETSLANRKGNE